jgi:ribosomal protein L37AE/L43A
MSTWPRVKWQLPETDEPRYSYYYCSKCGAGDVYVTGCPRVWTCGSCGETLVGEVDHAYVTRALEQDDNGVRRLTLLDPRYDGTGLPIEAKPDCGVVSEHEDGQMFAGKVLRRERHKVVAGIVRYADDLYGSRMQESWAAKKYLDEHPEVALVEVHEHGGWWMQYVRYIGHDAQAVKGEGLCGVACVGSANDQAVFPDWVYEWKRRAEVHWTGPSVVQNADGTQVPWTG